METLFYMMLTVIMFGLVTHIKVEKLRLHRLAMQSDGNLAIIDKNCKTMW